MRTIFLFLLALCTSAHAQSVSDQFQRLSAKGSQYVDLCVLTGQNKVIEIKVRGRSDSTLDECIQSGKSAISKEHAKFKEVVAANPAYLQLLKDWYIEWQTTIESAEPTSTENEFRYLERMSNTTRQLAKVSKRAQLSMQD